MTAEGATGNGRPTDEVTYLYRGTTLGWPGTPTTSGEGITPTSTDPLIATLFAVE